MTDAELYARQSLRELTANLMRIATGGGSPDLLQNQLTFAIGALANERRDNGDLAPAHVQVHGWLDFRNEQDKKSRFENPYVTIMAGSLRLAAHRLLDEEPAFGGKNSVRVIHDGIGRLTEK